MDTDYDVAVIGAGIAGVSTALHLLFKGKKVLLIDRRDAGQETSYGNSGIIETSHVLPFPPPPLSSLPAFLAGRLSAARINYPYGLRYIPWMIDFYRQSSGKARRRNGCLLRPLISCGIEEHKILMRNTNAERYFSPAGRVKLHRSPSSFEGAAPERQTAQEMGVPFTVMDAKEFREIEPGIRPVFYKASLWTGSARLTNPGAVVAAYADRFAREGGTFCKASVQGLEPCGGHWTIRTNTANFRAGQVAVCAGPWARDMLKPLGYRFPLGIKRGYHLHFSAAAELSHAIVDADIGYLIIPMEQGIRLTTGAEFAPMDAPPHPVQLGQALPSARELFPLGEALEEKPWMGGRPCFADSLPAIGPAPRHAGLWLNIGHGHSGIGIGPAAGRLLAEMMTGEKPFCDPAPYSPGRFGGTHG
jgi:D-amino-acid dehydrogenase